VDVKSPGDVIFLGPVILLFPCARTLWEGSELVLQIHFAIIVTLPINTLILLKYRLAKAEFSGPVFCRTAEICPQHSGG
jgi:hypothetical protein